jgi:putative ribosome biogenesis GTPase RsgA
LEFEEVKRKIATTEARLEKADADGLLIDNPGVTALRNELIRL